MTPGIQSPFFLLLLLPVLPGEGPEVWRGLPCSCGIPGLSVGFISWQMAPRESEIADRCEQVVFPMTRPGSVVVELTLVFREGTTNAKEVMSQFYQLKEEGSNYNLNISRIKVVLFPSSAQSGSGVPGWGIALLVLVCVLLALAILYLIALAVCRCRQKNYGHLDIFPSRETYHPMSEYPTYHTHGRYMPPGSTNRSPYEEVSAGNGRGSLSYTNPAVAATSANL
uniref:Mucin-1 n=1 Tax=Marmota marmota marmota TaxID=9994 RepID=A0A8C5ZNN1_MARMA